MQGGTFAVADRRRIGDGVGRGDAHISGRIDLKTRDDDDARILIGPFPAPDRRARVRAGRKHHEAEEGGESRKSTHVSSVLAFRHSLAR